MGIVTTSEKWNWSFLRKASPHRVAPSSLISGSIMSIEFVQNFTWTVVVVFLAGVGLWVKLLSANYAVDLHVVAAPVCDVQ